MTRAMDRLILVREQRKVKTPYGKVTVKIGRLDGRQVHFSPEYEDCRRLAETSNVPLREVFAAAMREWRPVAEQGDAGAQNALGAMYEYGKGVQRNFVVPMRGTT